MNYYSNSNISEGNEFSDHSLQTHGNQEILRICKALVLQKINVHITEQMRLKYESKKHQIKVSVDDLITWVVSDVLVPLLDGKLIPEVLISMEPHGCTEVSIDQGFLNRAIQIVRNYIGDKTFGVEKMAHELYLSRTQLYRKLITITGLSPNEFINEIRLLRAAEKIRLNTDSISRIGHSVGFARQSYFAKKFRKRFGINPKKYGSSGLLLKENMSMHIL